MFQVRNKSNGMIYLMLPYYCSKLAIETPKADYDLFIPSKHLFSRGQREKN